MSGVLKLPVVADFRQLGILLPDRYICSNIDPDYALFFLKDRSAYTMHAICCTRTREVYHMTLYEFGILDEGARVDLVYLEGVYLGKRKEAGTTLVLYQLNGFYVEISYRKYRYHIHRIRAFASTFLLDPYLDNIVIENLVGF